MIYGNCVFRPIKADDLAGLDKCDGLKRLLKIKINMDTLLGRMKTGVKGAPPPKKSEKQNKQRKCCLENNDSGGSSVAMDERILDFSSVLDTGWLKESGHCLIPKGVNS